MPAMVYHTRYQYMKVLPCLRRYEGLIVAGRDVTEQMQLLLRKNGYVFHTSAEKEVVRTIKEKEGYVALDPKKEEKEWIQAGGRGEGKIKDYTLPDGNKIKLGSERYKAPEILFDPEIIGLEYPGVHQIVVDAIKSDGYGLEEVAVREYSLVWRLDAYKRVWRPTVARGTKASRQGHENQNICTTGEKV